MLSLEREARSPYLQEAFPDLPGQSYLDFVFAQHPTSSSPWNLLHSAWYWLLIWIPLMCPGPAISRGLVLLPVLAQ